MTHENFHKKNTQLINDGFQRFRATEDCGTADCQFYGQKTTHFHCRYPGVGRGGPLASGRDGRPEPRPQGRLRALRPHRSRNSREGGSEASPRCPAWWEQGGASSRPHVAL